MRLHTLLHPVVVLSLLTLHLMVGRVGGYPLTLAPFAAIVFIAAAYRATANRSLHAAILALLLLPWINVAQVFESGTHIEFLRSYALWSTSGTMLLIAAGGTIASRRFQMSTIAFWGLAIVTAFSVLQTVTATVWDTYVLHNPWRGMQYLYQLDFASFPQPRAHGFYLEPSYNALVVFILYAILVFQRHRPLSATVLTLMAMAATRSLAGVLAIALFGLAVLAFGGGTRITGRQRMAALGVVALAIPVLATQYSERIASLGVEGSSANARVVAPLSVVADVIADYPTGIALGRMLEFTSAHDELHNQVLHNGVYVLAMYLGWVLVPIAAYLARTAIVVGGRGSSVVLMIAVVIALGFTGSVLTPEFAFLMILLIYAFRTRPQYAP